VNISRVEKKRHPNPPRRDSVQGKIGTPPVFAAKTVASLFSLVLGLALLLFCSREPRKEPAIDGLLLKMVYPTRIVSYDRVIEIQDDDALPQIPKVTLNDKPLPMVSWNPIDAAYEDTQPFPTDTSYELMVTHYWGEASSKINMPADFAMTRPESTYVLNRDSALTVTWRSSRGATWYWLNLFLDYDYVDTLYEWDYYEFDRDTIVFDTTCVYVRNCFFPWYVRAVLEGEGEAVVWACDGPPVQPGVTSNLQGHGFGYYMSVNQPREAYFIVVTPPATGLDRSDLMRRCKERFQRRLRQMSGFRDSVPVRNWPHPKR
jgi:hypothetical protein